MTTTYGQTTYDHTTTSQHPGRQPISDNSATPERFPMLFWAALILFVVNLLILFGIWIAPELRVSVYGDEQSMLSAAHPRPSPFTEQVQMAAARKPRQPEKVVPIVYEEPQGQMEASAEMAMPRQSQTAAAAQPRTADQAVQSYSDFPRVTASAARPGEPARHVGSVDISPRRATEQP